MRITQVTGEYPPMRGGVADYTALLSHELRRQGHDVAVLTSVDVKDQVASEVVRVDARVADWGTGFLTSVQQHLDAWRPDVLHLQYQTGAFGMKIGVNVLPLVLRLARRPVPLVVTFHDLKVPYLLPKIGPARNLATVALAAGADAIVVTNDEDWRRLASRRAPDRARPLWGGARLAAIPIGSNIPSVPAEFDRAATRRAFGISDDDFVIAYFGFIIPSKGVDRLVDALKGLVPSHRSIRLLMVGAARGDTGRDATDYEASIKRSLASESLRDHVLWTGYLDAKDVARALGIADAAALPYRQGASLRHGTLMAALGQHLPVVTTASAEDRQSPRAPALPVLRDGENVLLVPPDDAVALTSALKRLTTDASLRARLRQGAGALASSVAWTDIARRTAALYTAILGPVV